jgi:3-oxoacyl-[acyl-carrier protein] reductase
VSRDTLLIAGASSDIGIALIRRIASRPDAPTILAHFHSGSARLQELVAALGSKLHLLPADFSVDAAVESLGETVLRDFGAPTGLVYLPGLPLRYERFHKLDLARLDRDLSVQLRSAIVLLRRLCPAMAKLPRARLVFALSSVTRGVPPKYMSGYSVAKHAQLGLMRALASEYSGTPLRVNAVTPSMTETRYLDEIPELARQMAAAANPLGRNAQPDEVAAAIEFLLSRDSEFVTGIELPVCGGSTF